LPGGYISFVNQETDEWQQILFVDPTQPPTLQTLGPATGARSMREWVDNAMAKSKIHAKLEQAIRNRKPDLVKRDQERRGKLEKISTMRARLYPH